MNASLYTLEISANGAPQIRIDSCRLHEIAEQASPEHGTLHSYYKTASEMDIWDGSRKMDRKAVCAALRALGVKCRSIGGYNPAVRVYPPAAMVADYATLDALWNVRALEGVSHRDIQNEMINRPEYQRNPQRWA